MFKFSAVKIDVPGLLLANKVSGTWYKHLASKHLEELRQIYNSYGFLVQTLSESDDLGISGINIQAR